MKKAVIIAVMLIVILVVGAFIYFVTGVSSVSAPIKKYEYSGNFDQLVSGVQNYTAINPNIRFKITDTTGSYSGVAIYMSMNIKNGNNDIEYGWKCETNNNGTTPKTIISLIEAYDITNKSGGYIEGAKGVKQLVDIFEAKLLMPLRKQHIELKPL